MLKNALDCLPHGPEFRFVDELVELAPGVKGTGIWRVDAGDVCLRGHFPGEPVVPGVLIAEALAQLAGVVAFSGTSAGNGNRGRLAQVNVKFLRGVVPPAEIRLEASLAREMAGLFMFNVRAMVSGEAAAAGSLVLAMALAGNVADDCAGGGVGNAPGES